MRERNENSSVLFQLEKEKNQLERIIRIAESRLKKAPEGTVRIVAHKKSYQFYLRATTKEKNGTYIPAAQRGRLVKSLIQKKYDILVLAAAKEQLSAVVKFLNRYDPDRLKRIYASLSEVERVSIVPAELSDHEYVRQWKSISYDRKLISEETPEHYTAKGERVRSKSEVMIADTLDQENIPYRYECPVIIGGVRIYPDFTVLRKRDRKELYWEHLGMMDDPVYSQNAVQRIRGYEKSGIMLGKDLILTAETVRLPINRSVILQMIREYCV